MKTKESIKRVKSLGFKVGIAYKGNDEIEEVKKEYGIFLDDFKKVEVEK